MENFKSADPITKLVVVSVAIIVLYLALQLVGAILSIALHLLPLIVIAAIAVAFVAKRSPRK